MTQAQITGAPLAQKYHRSGSPCKPQPYSGSRTDIDPKQIEALHSSMHNFLSRKLTSTQLGRLKLAMSDFSVPGNHKIWVEEYRQHMEFTYIRTSLNPLSPTAPGQHGTYFALRGAVPPASDAGAVVICGSSRTEEYNVMGYYHFVDDGVLPKEEFMTFADQVCT